MPPLRWPCRGGRPGGGRRGQRAGGSCSSRHASCERESLELGRRIVMGGSESDRVAGREVEWARQLQVPGGGILGRGAGAGRGESSTAVGRRDPGRARFPLTWMFRLSM